MKKIVFIFAFGLCANFALGQEVFGNESNAYALMPSVAVSSGVVSNTSISISGRWIVFKRTEIRTLEDYDRPAKEAWIAYDRKTKSSRKLDLPDAVMGINFMGDDQTLLFGTGQPRFLSGFCDLASGKSVALPSLQQGTVYLGEESYAPFIVAKTNQDNGYQCFFPSGRTLTFSLDRQFSLSIPLGASGRQVYFQARKKGTEEQRGLIAILDLQTSETIVRVRTQEDLELFEKYKQPELISPFVLSTRDGFNILSLREPLSNPLKTNLTDRVRLGSETWIAFSPQDDYFVYLDSGSLLLREIQSIDLKKAMKAADEAARQLLLSQVKQVGTALIIFGADNDDLLPKPEDWENQVKPYLRDASLLKNFNYTFKGGDTTSIQNPNQVEMGFILGVGGRAVVYVDGSARWIPNP